VRKGLIHEFRFSQSKGDKPVVNLPDDSKTDSTPFAHPAFWRGQDDGVRGAVMVLRRVLAFHSVRLECQ